MDIRESCPLCNCEQSTTIKTLKINQHFINFIEEYYGNKSFKLIGRFIDKDI